jgi:hypothetical protein
LIVAVAIAQLPHSSCHCSCSCCPCCSWLPQCPSAILVIAIAVAPLSLLWRLCHCNVLTMFIWFRWYGINNPFL